MLRATHVELIDTMFRLSETDERTAEEQFTDLQLAIGDRLLLEDDPDGRQDISVAIRSVVEWAASRLASSLVNKSIASLARVIAFIFAHSVFVCRSSKSSVAPI